MASGSKMSFAPMISIIKKPTTREVRCSDWVATEKIHGASFQFSTNDGETIHMGSRTRCLDGQASFQKCNLAEYLARHSDCVKKVYHAVTAEDRWQDYRAGGAAYNGDDSDSDCDDMAARRARDNGEASDGEGAVNDSGDVRETAYGAKSSVEVRIYGELYGGGGVEKGTNSVIQKEILYCDEHRFYVFGITVNQKWVNVNELNDLCRDAGFPYFAVPVCEPKATLEELHNYLAESGIMSSKSKFTEREDDLNTQIEGVVMSPLTRPDYRHHAIKLLSAAFNDVRMRQNNKNKVEVNYCTKARYMSVISKLDIPEREDTEMVTQMFVADVEKESGEVLSNNKRRGCVKAVRQWLTIDGYIKLDHRANANKGATSGQQESAPANGNQSGEESEPEDGGFAGLFGD